MLQNPILEIFFDNTHRLINTAVPPSDSVNSFGENVPTVSGVAHGKWRRFHALCENYKDQVTGLCWLANTPVLRHFYQDHTDYFPLTELVFLNSSELEVVPLLPVLDFARAIELKGIDFKAPSSAHTVALIGAVAHQLFLTETVAFLNGRIDKETLSQNVATTLENLVPYYRPYFAERDDEGIANYIMGSFLKQSLGKAAILDDKTKTVLTYPKYHFGMKGDGPVIEALELFENTARSIILQTPLQPDQDCTFLDCLCYGTPQDKIALFVAAVNAMPELKKLVAAQSENVPATTALEREILAQFGTQHFLQFLEKSGSSR
jgi:hypothetical protein